MKLPRDRQVVLSPPQQVRATTLRVWEPTGRRRGVAILLAHGAGSGLDEPTLTALCRGLGERGVTGATFAFPYRQAGRRPPDRADRLVRAFVDVMGAFARDCGADRIVLGGRSLGGRVATLLAADGHGDAVLALGYPLWPGGRPPADVRRTSHWPRIAVPVLFVHGDRDRLCPVAALDDARHAHLVRAPHRAHVVAGADHGFTVRVRDPRTRPEVEAELLDAVDRWLLTTVEGPRDG